MNGIRWGMMGNFEGRGMMKWDFDKKDLKKLSTGDLATLKANQATLQVQMQKISALQDDYASLLRFIQRGDITNASTRIDLVTSELAQLKTALPAFKTITK
jgi:hypothetical protein